MDPLKIYFLMLLIAAIAAASHVKRGSSRTDQVA
jgi:hypothetical protein